MLRLLMSFFAWKFGHFSYEPLVCCRFLSCPQAPPVEFLGTLDDEEFFVVEGSGGGGVAGSLDSQVTRHQLVSVTHCIADVMWSSHSHQAASQTITTTTIPKRRRLVHAVGDRAFLPGSLRIWDSGWVTVPSFCYLC